MWRACLAEFLGTLLFVHVLCGAILATRNNILDVGLALGLAILVLNYCFVDLSGAYFNPAITLAACLVRQISAWRALFYFIAQILGAIVGVVVLYALVPHNIAETKDFELIATDLHYDLNKAEGLFMEAVITFVLVFVVLMIDINQFKRATKPLAPLVIGATLIALFLFAGPFTGASFNPARSFGAACVSGYWENHWIYWLGPLIGSLLAVLFFKIFETHWHDLEREGELKREERPIAILSAE